MALTNTGIQKLKPSGTKVGKKHSDGQGLYLHVKPAGKYWRMSYRFNGKQKTLALGTYPEVTLLKAVEASRARAIDSLIKELAALADEAPVPAADVSEKKKD